MQNTQNKHRSDGLLADFRYRLNWKRLTSILSLLVVLATVTSLISPAITLTQPVCELAEHVHTEDCYGPSPGSALVCGEESLELHAHSESCYDGEGKLTCTLPEHLALHTHGESCQNEADELVCTLPELKVHQHADSCWKAGETVTDPGHTHTDECYAWVPSDELICALPEDEAHTHQDSCYNPVRGDLICTEEEREASSHTADPTLVCQERELALHTHTDECYTEGLLTCTLPEVIEHSHSEDCFQPTPGPLNCEQQEHVHTWECYPEGTPEGTPPEDQQPEEELPAESEEAPAGDALPYTCGLEESDTHSHTADCFESWLLGRVMLDIEALPTVEELNATMAAYEAAGDGEGQSEYFAQLTELCILAYDNYKVIPEEEREQIVNLDKLMALESIWSAAAADASFSYTTPSPVQTVSTKDFIELNLYNYNEKINTRWRADKAYPGFQWNGGAYMRSNTFNSDAIDYTDFGNSIIANFTYGGTNSGITNGLNINAVSVVRQGGRINTIDISDYGVTNRPTGLSVGTTVLRSDLGSDGYPVLAENGGSLAYLFTPSSTYGVTKVNTASIDGLFQKDATGYFYNSRYNHAQYNQGSNTFTVYDSIITPNFIAYPFGNFLPFNTITNKDDATQVSSISRIYDYVQKIQENLSSNTNATRNQLNTMLGKYKSAYATAASGRTPADAIKYYLTGEDDATDDTSQITNSLLSRMYNIDWDVATDFFFGMEMKMTLMQPKDGVIFNGDGQITTEGDTLPMFFYFTGDDDVWVYIDGKLVLDLSGIHRHVGGAIDFQNGIVLYFALDTEGTGDVGSTWQDAYHYVHFEEIFDPADLVYTGTTRAHDGSQAMTFPNYSSHDFRFFYMERGSGSSVCRLNFNFPILRENSISVAKELTVEDETIQALGDPDFSFQILKPDGSLFIGPHTTFQITKADGTTATGTTDANGVFKIKAGDVAEFAGLDENLGQYIVRELLDPNAFGQYGTISVNGKAVTVTEDVTIGSTTFTGASSPVMDISDGSTYFSFDNHVDITKLGSLSIEKILGAAETTSQVEETFEFLVTLDGAPLPVGTEYTLYTGETSETATVTTAGMISLAPDQQAVIPNLLAGSTFQVSETAASAQGYTVVYSGDGTNNGSSISGVIQRETELAVTVTNTEWGTTLTIPGIKTLTNPNDAAHTYTFTLTEVTDATGTVPVEGGKSESDTVTFPANSTGNTLPFHFDLTYFSNDAETYPVRHYYKVTETIGSELTAYDETVHILEVTVTWPDMTSNTLDAQVTGWWKDGEAQTLPEDLADLSLSFTNTLLSQLSLTKETIGSGFGPDADFTFTLALEMTDGSAPLTGDYPLQRTGPDGSVSTETVTFTEGKAPLTLKADETILVQGLPAGADWTITEHNTEGIKVTFTLPGTAEMEGNSISGTLPNGSLGLRCINNLAYELPDTGGSGPDLYLFSGLALLVLAGLMMVNAYSKRKGAG